MKVSVLAVDVHSEHDVATIRRRAGEVARAAGLEGDRQTRLVWRVTQAAFDLLNRGGGSVELLMDDGSEHSFVLCAGAEVVGIPGPASLEDAIDSETEAVVLDVVEAGRLFDQEHIQVGASRDGLRRLLRNGDGDRETRFVDAMRALRERVRSASFLDESASGRISLLEALVALRDRDEELRKLTRAAEQSPAMILVTDAGGTIEFVNPRFCEVTGYSAEEVIGKKPNLLKSGETPADEYERLWKTILSGKEWRGEFHNRKKNGELYWEIASISPITDDNGVITHFLAIKEDITDRKRVEQELIEAREEAEKASRAKSEFLANMSHEIRTPLNAIIGMADLLWESPLTPEQKEYVRVFRRASSTLLNLINDVLDLSKVEAGHFELENVEFDLRSLVEKTCEVMAVPAHEKNVELACHVKPEVPIDLVGDPSRLRQVITNLIGNAVKFTERGEVVLEVGLDPATAENAVSGESCRLLFSVRDTGIGIPAEKLDSIFDRFSQGNPGTSRRYGGTGLGLTISRRLVELMGGRMWVESEVGRGSTFFFTAEFRLQPQQGRTAPLVPSDLKGLRVLVVDDNSTNRFILKEMLATWGAQVVAVSGGQPALAELRRARDLGDPYKLALLDCRMPDMDGFEIAEWIGEELGSPDTTVMMLTSDRLNGDLTRVQEMGIAHYLVKPIKRSDLLAGIAAAMGRPYAATEDSFGDGADAQEPEDLRPLRVLLVEDSEDSQLLIQSYLKKTPYVLEFAENGQVAVEKFTSSHYDIVLMDTQMPVLDGSTATRTIRSWESEHGRNPTPIVALTAHALREDAQRSLAAGCDAHLAKPVKKAKLLETIREHTSFVPIADAGAAGAEHGGGANGRIVVRADADIIELIPRYLENRRKDIDWLRELLERGDLDAIRNLGHTMKGTGGGYGFDAISEIGKALEKATAEQDRASIQKSIDRLTDYLERVDVVIE